MTPQPKTEIALPRPKRRVVRRRVARDAPVPQLIAEPNHPLTGAQFAERFKNNTPDPDNAAIRARIEAARAAEKHKALDAGVCRVNCS